MQVAFDSGLQAIVNDLAHAYVTDNDRYHKSEDYPFYRGLELYDLGWDHYPNGKWTPVSRS